MCCSDRLNSPPISDIGPGRGALRFDPDVCDGTDFTVGDLRTHKPVRRSLTRSTFGDVDDSVSKGLRGFLRQIVPDASTDDPVRIFAREFLGV